jgi:GNAT superfamily N-acetyltransferase
MIELRPATTDEDLATVARIVTTVSPDNPTSVEDMRWSDEKYPGGRRFVAWLDGIAAGAGGAGRIYMFPPDFDGLWGNISVLPELRRRGVGSALLAALSDVARDAGKTMLMGRTTSDQQDAIDFLEHRGFREHERMKVVRLELAGVPRPVVAAPEGLLISSLEEHPELVPGVFEVAREALPDIPGDGPMAPETLDEFRKRDVDRPTIPPGAFVLGIDAATGAVVGYANLMLVPGNPKVAWHGMTGVARSWRGRGVATALKRATIAWAIDNGLEALEGANDIVNAPMRAVNRRLGYQPQPDEVGFRGPLAPLGAAPVAGPAAHADAP